MREIHVGGIGSAAGGEFLRLRLLAQQGFRGFRRDGLLFAGLRLRPGVERIVPFNSGLTPPSRRNAQTNQQRHHDRRRRRGHQFVPAKRLLELVGRARRPGKDRLVIQVPLEIGGQPVGRLVTAGAVLLQALHHNPVQVALELVDQLGGIGGAAFGRGRQFLSLECQ